MLHYNFFLVLLIISNQQQFFLHALICILDLLACRNYFLNSNFQHSLTHERQFAADWPKSPLFSARQKQRLLIDVSGWMDEKRGRKRMAPFLLRVWLEEKTGGKIFLCYFLITSALYFYLNNAMQIHFEDYRGCIENLRELLIWEQIIMTGVFIIIFINTYFILFLFLVLFYTIWFTLLNWCRILCTKAC